MRIVPAALLALSLAALPPTGPAAAQQLRAQAAVERDVVTLGDLFVGIPIELASRAVANAPRAGRSVTFEAPTLAAFARAHNVPWSPKGPNDRVTVERAGAAVEPALIEAALADALRREEPGAEFTIRIDGRLPDLLAPAGAPPRIGVEQLTIDRTTGRFSAQIAVPADDPAAERVRVSGRTQTTIEVPVLARPIGAGEIIRREDVQLVALPASRLAPGTVADLDRLIGKASRRPLAAQRPIRTTDVAAPVLVARNSVVTVRVSGQNGLTLAMTGRALDEGAEGDRVRVLNTRSSKQIEGIVVGAGLVEVGSAASPLSAPAAASVR